METMSTGLENIGRMRSIDASTLFCMAQNRRRVLTEFFPNGSGLDDRHNFRVSAEGLKIEPDEEAEISAIAEILPGYLDGLGRIIALSMIDDKYRRTDPTFRALRLALDIEGEYGRRLANPTRDPSRKFIEHDHEAEQQALVTQISSEHPFARLDLVKDAQTGTFSIVEIEVDKLHGFGYATLCRDLATNPLGQGLVHRVADICRTTKTGMLLSGDERFYLPEARYFAERVRAQGGDLVLVAQQFGREFGSELHIDEQGISAKGARSAVLQQLLSVPRFKGSKEETRELDEQIALAQAKGQVRVLSRRVPSLGEKAALGIISNPSNNEPLESILNACFEPRILEGLRQYIPSTEFLGFASRQRICEVETEIKQNSDGFFLKVINQSGARGVAAPGDLSAQLDLIKRMSRQIILQKAIRTPFVQLPFTDVQTGENGVDDFTIRYALFVSQGAVMDLALTASPGIVAHGGTHSIQLSSYK